MNQRRSIQDIVPPARSKPIRPAVQTPPREEEPAATPPPKIPHKKPRPAGSGGRGFLSLIGIALALVIVVGVLFGVVSTFFHSATVKVTLNQFTVPIAASFEASPDGVLLSFMETTVEETASQSVPRSGTEYVEARASGTITVFNEATESSQRLITNTRFEAPNGRIYRIEAPLVVPGYTTESGAIVPGQVDVVVYADEAGEDYNASGTLEFTIPGLRGTDQYEDMYARSKGPLSGGFVGEQAVVSESVREAAVAELKNELDGRIREKFNNEVGGGVLVFPETVQVDFVEEPDAVESDGAVVSVVARATAPVFSESKVANVIAAEGGLSFEGALRITNLDELIIEATPSETEGNLTVTISGEAALEGAYDEERLLQDLAGKDRRNVGVILSGYPAIADMRISVYPFWRGTLPEKPERLSLEVANGENP